MRLAVTSHPDFDDTPLWDETMDADFGNDAPVSRPHWVVLAEDDGSSAGLSVPSQTAWLRRHRRPLMPMYLDSGYHAFARGSTLSVVVPAWQLRGVDDFF
ncbi:MAG: hypothetical protein R3B99_06600 [Polyangiales bacterium]